MGKLLTTMFKNESKSIQRMLESWYEHIDYWIFQDNGSTDGTPEIVDNFFADKNIPGFVYRVEEGWKGFGWNCININGHDPDEINSAIIKTKRDMPTVIISKTIKGKGVKFMENNNDWHHGMLSKKLLDQALDGLN